MSKTLLVMRHAKSAWDQPVADHDRLLADRGKRQAPAMGRFLKKIKLVPDLIVHSTAARAAGTARLVAEALGGDVELVAEDAIYDSSTGEVIRAVQKHGHGDVVMVVGHNPTFEYLVSQLVGGGRFRMPTSSIACIEMADRDWNALGSLPGVLQWIQIPKVVEKLLKS